MTNSRQPSTIVQEPVGVNIDRRRTGAIVRKWSSVRSRERAIKKRYDPEFYKMHRDEICAANRAWAQKNKAKRSARAKIYYDENKEMLKLKKREFKCEHATLVRARARAATRRYRERKLNIKKVLVQLLGGCCVRCGYSDARALDFDHAQPSTKSFNICLNLHQPLELLETEVKKCQLLCANCHRVKTLEDNDYALFLRPNVPKLRPIGQILRAP